MTRAWADFRRAVRYLRPYHRLAGVSVVLTVAASLTALLLPWPLKWIVDSGLGGQPLPGWLTTVTGPPQANRVQTVVLLTLCGFGVTLLSQLVAVVASYVNTTVEQRMTLDFRSDLFLHVQSLSMVTHDQRRAGMMIYAINALCDGVPRVVMSVPPLAQSGLTLVGMFAVTLWIDPTMAVLAVTVVPFLYQSVGFYAGRIQPRLVRVKELEGESLAIVHEAMSMIRVIAAFVREPWEYRKFRAQGEKAVTARIRLTVIQTTFSLGVQAITAAGTAAVLGYGAYRVLDGRLTTGQLLIVLAYVAALYYPLQAISHTVGGLQDTFVNLRMAFDLMDVRPVVAEHPRASAVGRVAGAVRYDGVGFSYPGRGSTLADVSLDVRPGQVVAVVGPTGAGKTTLVSLLPRFYDVDAGRVLIDDRDIRQFTLASLREQISIVLQEPLLFSGSVLENIRYGRLAATREEVEAAARAANAHDFIARLPQGYDTALGERGATISGGERQRIAVARAFLKDAPILILDEPTSSVDSRTEAVILDALDRLMAGRTTFMIAHRLSTVRRADLVVVMDAGRVVEHGTHAELLARNGLYRQLYDLQSHAVPAADSAGAAV